MFPRSSHTCYILNNAICIKWGWEFAWLLCPLTVGMLREHNDRNGASRSSLTLGSIQSDVDKSVRSDTDD